MCLGPFSPPAFLRKLRAASPDLYKKFEIADVEGLKPDCFLNLFPGLLCVAVLEGDLSRNGQDPGIQGCWSYHLEGSPLREAFVSQRGQWLTNPVYIDTGHPVFSHP